MHITIYGSLGNTWKAVSGVSSEPISLAYNDNNTGQMWIAAKGANSNSIWVGTVDSQNFSVEWRKVPGGTLSTPVLVYNPDLMKMMIFVRGTDNGIYVGSFNQRGGF